MSRTASTSSPELLVAYTGLLFQVALAECYKGRMVFVGRVWESEFRAANKGGPRIQGELYTHFEVVSSPKDVSGSVFTLFFTDGQNGQAES